MDDLIACKCVVGPGSLAENGRETGSGRYRENCKRISRFACQSAWSQRAALLEKQSTQG